MLTLDDAGPELHELDDTLDELEDRLEDVTARLDEIARALAGSATRFERVAGPAVAMVTVAAPIVPPPALPQEEPAPPVLAGVPAPAMTAEVVAEAAEVAEIADEVAEVADEVAEAAEGAVLAEQVVEVAEVAEVAELVEAVAEEPCAARPGGRRLGTTLLMAPMVLVALAFAACTLPGLVGYRVMVVSGGSMEPAIPLGSVAFTRLQPADHVAVGDVVLVNPGIEGIDGQGRYLHRVERIAVEDGKVAAQTRGDANEKVDPDWVALDRDVPTLAWSLPLLGYLLAALATPPGWVALVLAPAFLTCLAMVRQIWADA